jgi:hypothetical protein
MQSMGFTPVPAPLSWMKLLTTPPAIFGDNRLKSFWVMKTWKTVKEIMYKRLNSPVIDSRVKYDKTIAVVDGKIKTIAGETT